MAGVVVWSFLDDRRRWVAYEPTVSAGIEQLFNTATVGQVNLGSFCPSLASYKIDLQNMHQIQTRTGSVRTVQRHILPLTSAHGKGVVWKFEGDSPSTWIRYDIDSMELIEGAYDQRNQRGAPHVFDLQHTYVKLPYIIDFRSLTQTRTDTQKVRQIKREFLSQSYPSPLSNQSGMSQHSSVAPPSAHGSGGLPQTHQAQHKSGKHKGARSQPYSSNAGHMRSGQVTAQGTNQIGPGASSLAGYNIPAYIQAGPGLSQPSQAQVNSQGPLTRGRMQQQSSGPPSAVGQPPGGQSISLQQQLPSNSVPLPLSAHQPLYPQLMQSMPNPAGFINPNLSTSVPGMHVAYPQVPPMIHPSQIPVMPSGPPQLPPPAHQSSQPVTSTTASTVSPLQESLPRSKRISIGKSQNAKLKTGLEVLSRYMVSIHTDLDKHDCIICCDKLSEASSYGEGQPDSHDAVKLNQCGHLFHKLCLLEMYNSIHKDDSIQCPSCKTIYGEKTGNCPAGYMQWKIINGLNLAGYESYSTIHVSYHISPGVQGPEHPNPGERYSTHGFPRQGFLPDCDQGRKVLKLLIEAFKRRLMFTIGTSHTTGESNTVTWNEIHHKTEPHGNYSGHGYPDPNYLDNVLSELAAHGVTEDCLK